MRTSTRAALALVVALAAARGAQAQDDQLVTSTSFITGISARGYSVDAGPNTRQFAFPIALVMPVNERLSVDVGTYFASTRSEVSGAATTVSGLTDTQVRGSYVFGRDALVATVMVNLPTGKKQTTAESGVLGVAAANFLSFPVNSYRTGLSVTGGLAVATTAGSWNLGLAGSLRMSGEYTPFTDDNLTYSPGTEGRIKVAADRTLGTSRLAAGFTFSTFGNDDFANLSGGGNGTYQPGNRYIGELSLSFLAGNGTLTGYAWDFYRQKAGGAGSTNQENIFSLGASGSWPMGRNMRLEPLLEARFWSPDQGSGSLFGGGAALQIPMGEKITISPAARFDFGKYEFTDGSNHNITGWGASLFIRYEI
ncbi:MAG TPA: hypothetical protein VGP80_07355 [Gemmatimonadales bacterium]|nr:hypothetical protein [Gemmatimonadales bacterium]